MAGFTLLLRILSGTNSARLPTSMERCLSQTLNLSPQGVWVAGAKVLMVVLVVWVVGGWHWCGCVSWDNEQKTESPHSFLILLNVHHPGWTINRRTAPSTGSWWRGEVTPRSPKNRLTPLSFTSLTTLRDRAALLERPYCMW